MATRRSWIACIPAALLVVLLTDGASAQDAPRFGGVLKAAMIGEPPTLDTHTTTATIAYQVGWHIFEGLYTYDKNYAAIPMLAESHTITDGGRRYTITLRKGVRFQAPWLTLFPGAAIMAGILGPNLFGDGLRDLLDPKLRGVHGAGREA
jgi:ABC-type transport system substrate-binding protein